MKKFKKATMFVSTTAAVANVLPVAEVKADGFWAWLWKLIVGRFFTTNTKNSATANSPKIEEKSNKQVYVPLCIKKEKEVNTEQKGTPLNEKEREIVGSEDLSDKNREIVVDALTANSQKIEEKSKKQVYVPLYIEKGKEINTEQRGIPLDEEEEKIVGSEDLSDKNRKIVVDSFAQLKKKACFVSETDAETEFTLNVPDFRERIKPCSYSVFNPLVKVCLLENEVRFVSLKSKEVLKRLSLKDENFKEEYSKSLVWLKNLEGVYNLIDSNIFLAGEHYRNGEKFIERRMTLQDGDSKDSLVFKPNFDCKIDFEIGGSKGLVVKSLELDNVNLRIQIKTKGKDLDFDLKNCGDLKSLKSVIKNLDYDFKEDNFISPTKLSVVYE